MSFLYPLFLAGAAAIAIPIVLHLLRRDVAPEVPFAAVRLLRRVPIERTRSRRLRDLLLLAARVAALLLLAAAFARPFLTAADAAAPLQIVAVDRSFSMAAPGRFARAAAVAREAIDAAGRARVAVIAFDDRADVLLAGGTAAEARATLHGLEPGYGSTRYAPMLARAMELAGPDDARLVVVTDAQRAGWDGEDPVSVPANLHLELRPIDAGAGNAAVVQVRLEDGAVVALVRNEHHEPIAGAARLVVDGKPAGSAPFQAEAGQTGAARFPYRPADGAVMAVEIDDAGGYPADDRRFLLAGDAARPRVLVVTGDASASGFYVVRALQAAAGEHAFDVRVRTASTVGMMTGDEAAACRAVVLLSTRRLDRRGRDLLSNLVRGGAGLFVAGGDEVDPSAAAAIAGWRDLAATEAPAERVLAATDLRHPVFRSFGPVAANLGQVRFQATWTVTSGESEIAARFTDGAPALLERRGRTRTLVFASDLDHGWNDFPLHPAFVPFVLETVRYISSDGPAKREYVVGDAPPGVRAVPGAYATGEDGRRVVVNVDPRESATAVMAADEFESMVARTADAPAAVRTRRAEALEAQQMLWRYGLMLMLAALVAESAIGRAR